MSYTLPCFLIPVPNLIIFYWWLFEHLLQLNYSIVDMSKHLASQSQLLEFCFQKLSVKDILKTPGPMYKKVKLSFRILILNPARSLLLPTVTRFSSEITKTGSTPIPITGWFPQKGVALEWCILVLTTFGRKAASMRKALLLTSMPCQRHLWNRIPNCPRWKLRFMIF